MRLQLEEGLGRLTAGVLYNWRTALKLQTGADQTTLLATTYAKDCICSAARPNDAWRWWMCRTSGRKWFDLVADRSVRYLKQLSHYQQQLKKKGKGQQHTLNCVLGDKPLKGGLKHAQQQQQQPSRGPEPSPSLVYFFSIYLLCTNLDTRCIPNEKNKSKMWNVKGYFLLSPLSPLRSSLYMRHSKRQ